MRATLFAGALAALMCVSIDAQQPAPPSAAPAQGRGGPGRAQPDPLDFDDHEGWTQIFDGASMQNWDCDPEFWSIADGALIAKSTAEKPAGTVYCIYTGAEPADFELKLEMKLTGNANSGIQYRSFRQPPRGGGPAGNRGSGPANGVPPPGPPAAAANPAGSPPVPVAEPCSMTQYAGVGRGGGGGGRGRGQGGAAQPNGAASRPPNPRNIGGYQYDFNATGQYPGQLYENGGKAPGAPGPNRGIITYKGQVVQMIEGRRPRIIGCVGESNALRGVMNPNDWNQVHIIARKGVLIHMLNGHVMTISLDEDPTMRKDKGLIAVQIEGNPAEGPLTASFRNIWLRAW